MIIQYTPFYTEAQLLFCYSRLLLCVLMQALLNKLRLCCIDSQSTVFPVCCWASLLGPFANVLFKIYVACNFFRAASMQVVLASESRCKSVKCMNCDKTKTCAKILIPYTRSICLVLMPLMFTVKPKFTIAKFDHKEVETPFRPVVQSMCSYLEPFRHDS